ncbi:phosphoglycerate dehydrogenase [Bacillus luteolus]|uniref:D-3-phosphoglycerate dehydrogenase n=1 Tax=Litchfieldia luteola TaxID=682179 RepID=A0ABR9QPB3_9BACI|nr:phosphoglycerate dehydrogenase [Cytobacillus luteolus]MBE4910326.1 phosphoglycerate dehydrogenase [Cytobacillus luteolus]MBP1942099.1 D-3-phosphoglycerate dehydrogenase [Cytobacillus luteolus]
MFQILVADSISEEGLAPLISNESIRVIQNKVSEVEDILHEFDALLVRSATIVTEELLSKMKNLQIIARAGVGVDNIDVTAATKQGVVVINAPDGNTLSTAEHTFAMMTSLVRHIPQANISVKSRNWNRTSFVGTELAGKCLGIIGLGRIGTEIAKRAKAFSMTVQVYDPFLTHSKAEDLGVISTSLDDVLSLSDIITVHTPLTKETKDLLSYDNLAKTKKGVYVINCARGGIIDEQALVTYLENGHVAGAALDVFEVEPPLDNRLLEFEQVIVTPHLGASTKEAQLNVASQVAKEIVHFFEGKPVTSSINLPTLSREVFEKIQPYYELANKMGLILSQCMKEAVKEVNITYAGLVTELETTFISKSLLSGFLKSRVASTVNEVNAALIAKERGITFGESYSSSTSSFSNSITVKVIGEKNSFTIQGIYVADYGTRIVMLNGFKIDFNPSGHLLYIQHTDRPGVIGRVGKLLGDIEVNIATMQVGRKEIGGEAIMILSFDAPLQDDTVKTLQKSQDIVSVRKIDL